MTHPDSSTTGGSVHDGVNLRLLWPQWQGAGASIVEAFASEFPLHVARRGYTVGTAVLEAVLPPHDGPTVKAPVAMTDDGLEEHDGVEAKAVILEQLARTLEVVRRHDPARILTVGGECSVSVAPFSELALRYGDDLAIVWIDAHPDVGTPKSEYPGYHGMAVATLIGHGDPDVQELLPATVSAERVALAGVHWWAEDDFAEHRRVGHPVVQPRRASPIYPTTARLARGHRLLARGRPFRRRRGRRQRDRARSRHGTRRAHEHRGAAHRRRRCWGR